MSLRPYHVQSELELDDARRAGVCTRVPIDYCRTQGPDWPCDLYETLNRSGMDMLANGVPTR